MGGCGNKKGGSCGCGRNSEERSLDEESLEDQALEVSSKSCKNDGSPSGQEGDQCGFEFIEEPTLVREGWTRRHLLSADRVKESQELYEALGFEVKVVRPQLLAKSHDCDDCSTKVESDYFQIYTRKV